MTTILEGIHGLVQANGRVFVMTNPDARSTSYSPTRLNKLKITGTTSIRTDKCWVGSVSQSEIQGNAIDVDPTGRYVYISHYGDPGVSVGRVSKVDSYTSPMTTLARWTPPGLGGSNGIMYFNGKLYVTGFISPGTVYQINPDTMATEATWTGVAADGEKYCQFLTHDDTYIYVGLGFHSTFGGSAQVIQIDPSSMTTRRKWSSGDATLEYPVLLDFVDGVLYCAFSCSPGQVKKINVSVDPMVTLDTWTGEVGENEAQDIKHDNSGNIFVSLYVANGAVVRISTSNMTKIGKWVGGIAQDGIAGAVYLGYWNRKLYVGLYSTPETVPGQVVEVNPSKMTTLRYYQIYDNSQRLTVQPSSKDNLMEADIPTTNWGSYPELYVYDVTVAAGKMRSLIEYSINGIPSGTQIARAKLRLYYEASSGTVVGKRIWAYKLTRTDWEQGDLQGQVGDSSWNNYKSGTAWTTSGGDYVTSSPYGGSTTVPAAFGWMEWNIIDILQEAYANGNPAEILLKYQSEDLGGGMGTTRWWSNNGGPEALRPMIVVDYLVNVKEKTKKGNICLDQIIFSNVSRIR